MRVVLLAAVSTLCLVFTAHSAPLHHTRAHKTSEQSDTQGGAGLAQPLPSIAPQGTNCLETGASLSHAAYTTDDDADCCGSTPYCSQYLSTQMLITPPAQGRT